MSERRPIVRALVEAVLALDDPDFPAIEVEQIAWGLPPALLLSFDQVGLFAVIDAATRRAERDLLIHDVVPDADIDRVVAEKALADRQRLESFLRQFGPLERFAPAPLAARRAYLRLWARSGFVARRRVYTTLKGLVLMTAYALPELERAVGFERPGR
jgi:hypothetical protein